jgi:phenylalanyl-tRNA synthetase beta chain
VIRDAKGTVLSLPPIINGRHSRIQPSTKNVFIECTATDETKANVVCSTVVAMFAEYCSYRVEPVDVEYVKNGVITRTETTPQLASRIMTAPLRDVRGVVGLTDNELTPDAACALAEKMQLAPARYDSTKDEVSVSVPVTRSDILHAVDVAEDIGIAYGYNNIPETLPRTTTTGRPTRLNGFSDLLRDEVARAGYVEVLTHGLCRLDEQFDKLRHDDGKEKAVVLSNPASEEFEIVRTSLLVGALKTLECAKAHSVKEGLKLFEVNDVVHRDNNEDVGALNRRHLVATYTGPTAGFEVIHGLVDRVMTCAQIAPTKAYAGNSLKGYTGSSGSRMYSVEPIADPTYFPGRCARVLIEESGTKKSIGVFGVVHPEVLKNFGVANPTSALELDVEALAAASSVPPCGC